MFDEQAALMYDPFAGDFEGGGMGDRILRDKIVTARKAAECFICHESIKPGDRIRSRVEVYDGELMTFKFCQLCCQAMATSDDAIEERTQRGKQPS